MNQPSRVSDKEAEADALLPEWNPASEGEGLKLAQGLAAEQPIFP